MSNICDELMQAFNMLKQDNTLSDDDKKYISESKVYIRDNIPYYREYYKWKKYDKITFYRNYDYIYDENEHVGKRKVGKRKLNKEIYVFGLPDHCF